MESTGIVVILATLVPVLALVRVPDAAAAVSIGLVAAALIGIVAAGGVDGATAFSAVVPYLFVGTCIHLGRDRSVARQVARVVAWPMLLAVR